MTLPNFSSPCCGATHRGAPGQEPIALSVCCEGEAFLSPHEPNDGAATRLYANIEEEIVVEAGAMVKVPTGLRFAIPKGYEMQVRPLQKLAHCQQIRLLNTPGTIDSDYRGVVDILLINHGKKFIIEPKTAIAEFVLSAVVQSSFSSSEHEGLLSIPTFLSPTATFPSYATEGAAGADIRADIAEEMILPAGAALSVPTGLKFQIPSGYEIQIRPRSGLAANYQVTIIDSPATLAAGCHEELKIHLINFGKNDFIIEPKMRIAQLVVAPIVAYYFKKEEGTLSSTSREAGGFGHTGLI